MSTPTLTMKLSGDSLMLPQLKLKQLEAKLALDVSWNEPFTIDLTVSDLEAGENLIKQVTLHSSGYLKDHTAELFASHELADLSLALAGGYDNEQWQGTLNQLQLDSTDMGVWKIENPVLFNADAKAAKLNMLCLHHEESQLCANGIWDINNTNTGGKVTLTGFPLNALSAWLPETLTGIGGMFSLVADASMHEQLQAHVKADITPGEIRYATIKKEGSLSHEGMKLDLQLENNGLDANVWLSVNSNSISGTLQSPDLLSKNGEHSPILDGKVQIKAQNFELVETLIPDIKDLDASINSDFQIQGTLAKPEINGKGTLNINKILIPVAGLELSDTHLNILAHNSNVTLKGRFNTPKGSMNIDGKALIDAEKNYPISATLKANNFRLVNLPRMQIYLDSDLLLEKKQNLTQLTGTITVPRAEVLLRDLPTGATTVSPDVVIVQEKQEEEEEEGEKSPLHMNLKVSLGKKVHFAGLGVNAFIEGQVQLTAKPDEQMLGSGEFRIKEGSYRAYGQDLEIKTGVLSFPSGPLTKPGINLRATRTIGDIEVGIYAIGPAAKPRITTFSRPLMSESQTISYLLTGSAPSSGSGGAKLSIGRQINNKLSVSIGTDTKTGDSEFIARYRLSRRFSVQTTTGTSTNAADIFYTMEMGGKKTKEEKE
jgi:translocation and assembly module TamB